MKIRSIVVTPYHIFRRLLAKFWLLVHLDVEVIGVTGSYGKTNTSAAITSVLSEKFKTLQTDLNLDTNFNIPITILRLGNHEKLVLEYGIDHVGEMEKHLSLAKPKIAVITGFSPVHADDEHLGSLEKIIAEKSKLVQAVSKEDWVVLNYDDTNVRRIKQALDKKTIFYGTSSKYCDVWASNIKVDYKGTVFNLHVNTSKLPSSKNTIKVSTPLLGTQGVSNCLAAAAVGLIEHLSLDEIVSGLSKLKPLEGRLNIEAGPKGSVLLNDSRRSNPASAIAGLQTFKDLTAKRKIAILGEMGELGKYSEEGHRSVGKKVAEIKPDYLVCVGEQTDFIADEAKKKMKKDSIIFARDVFEAAGALSGILQKGDLIYLKGSLLKHVERIIRLLEGKEVDPDEIAFHRYEIYH